MSQSSTSDHRLVETKRTLKERIFQEFKEVVPMFLYLWLLFALFTYHEAIVLARHGISFKPFGLAFVNAFVFAKVMLVAEKLRIGTRFRKKAPVFPIFYKSFLFAVTFICFNLVEEVVIGLWKGKTIAESLPMIGGGSSVYGVSRPEAGAQFDECNVRLPLGHPLSQSSGCIKCETYSHCYYHVPDLAKSASGQ
jgi:hypothetical protein